MASTSARAPPDQQKCALLAQTAFNANPANFVVTPANFHVLGGYTFADENNRNVWEADRSNFQPRIGALTN